MKLLPAVLTGLASAMSAAAVAQADSEARAYEGPVVDMHVHAYPADGNGPAPNAICVGAAANLKYDPAIPWTEAMGRMMQNPRCDDPLQGPATDEEVRDQTIAAMRANNVIGVLSGPPERVAEWRQAAPNRFIPGYEFSLGRDTATAEEIAAAFDAGSMAVFAEVTNQYRGYVADDPAFDPYWAIAAEKDIPIGIHIGIGPPGSPLLYPDFTMQSPSRLTEVLQRHPTLRVYAMHAGFPLLEETKAMLYLFPQLYVDTGVMQLAAPREEYYAYLEGLVRAGFGDRIMFGSDQMNWPGLIEEGIDAINEAPFLTWEQKKAILHDNAARFLRLDNVAAN